MKKEYVKPNLVVEEVILETMLAASSNPDVEIGGGNGEQEGDFGANDRRGGWGDLWN